MNWPDDADGDVLRRLEDDGFDFSKSHVIDFNVDFDSWPPMPEAIAVLSRHYPNARLRQPDANDKGYVQFQIEAALSYDIVMKVQREVSSLMADFGGRCESWGVMNG